MFRSLRRTTPSAPRSSWKRRPTKPVWSPFSNLPVVFQPMDAGLRFCPRSLPSLFSAVMDDTNGERRRSMPFSRPQPNLVGCPQTMVSCKSNPKSGRHFFATPPDCYMAGIDYVSIAAGRMQDKVWGRLPRLLPQCHTKGPAECTKTIGQRSTQARCRVVLKGWEFFLNP